MIRWGAASLALFVVGISAVRAIRRRRRLRGFEVDVRSWRLGCYALVVLASHTIAGLITENVFIDKSFRFPMIMGAVQFAMQTCVPVLVEALLEGPGSLLRKLLQEVQQSPTEAALAAVCGLSMATHHCSGLASNVWINFTTNMIFSAARLPSVLVVGALFRIGGRQPQVAPAAYMCSLVVAVGLLLFSLGEKKADGPFSWVGLVFVSVNLLMGAVTFNLQECLLKRRRRGLEGHGKASTRQITNRFMILQYGSAAVFTFLAAWGFGDFGNFRRWSEDSGHSVLARLSPILAEAICNAVGVAALLHVTAEFDAARASIITSTRKACTFLLSFLVFPKPFGPWHACGTLLTVAGSFGVHRSLE